MIIFNNLILSEVPVNKKVKNWIVKAILNENLKEGEVNYIFCDDNYLSELNIKYLKHNTLTDIISFDYTIGKIISGDIFISIERVKENAELFNTKYVDELHRVMIHGVLHYCGYKDKTDEEKTQMRSKEDYYLSLRDF
ncbi:MAG: rRNA maturation RNase YbeY [Flavobacteriales bacterium CG03_land_8_20_14_0_80_35_15]|nr:rRNA maturation RNase YbeY [Zetaproteobacteria bacterium]PIR12583.1 MAG: rRNA maturation RNase YbeY [Flavobacteriales bacterium CG11_big_fil_rev_8_21_14_0_20_35_7]PIV16599.1 MAG: rRNA maturation RNase YbeY [Flavobacteriales bacterium CG03_land_8_20_14_0_80_35_15]PJA04980.1 MAG: rRNA maturation RNase YbeY [Flavobacteriales bacterium CG_4_10_14_0_2_um_filter_35_18]